MSDSNLEIPPLDADVEALLRVERDRPSVGGVRAERMWSAILLELGAAAIPGAPDASPAGGPASAGQSAAGQLLPRLRGRIELGGSGLGKLVLLKALPWMGVSLAVGSIGGFVAGHRVGGPRASLASVPRQTAERRAAAAALEPAPVPSPVELPSPATTAPIAAPIVPAVVLRPAAPAPHGNRGQVARSDDDLAGEEVLLGRAETALRAGNWSATLSEIEAYDRRYPNGQLAEEAAYLGVRACQRGGDAVLTQSRLRDFHRRFPLSPLGKSSGE